MSDSEDVWRVGDIVVVKSGHNSCGLLRTGDTYEIIDVEDDCIAIGVERPSGADWWSRRRFSLVSKAVHPTEMRLMHEPSFTLEEINSYDGG